MKWNIGCAGLGYKAWKDVFYRDKSAEQKWFNFYASQFHTMEITNTFYQFPTVAKLLEWHDKSPGGFSFSCKVPKQITHFKQLINADKLLGEFYKTCKEGLREKLGALLFQFPPKYTYTEERLDQIINTLDNSFTNVVEFRDSSWWNEEIFARLAKHTITFCGISYPALPNDVIICGPELYYRFHGVPTMYVSDYNEADLQNFANGIEAFNRIETVNCYFNNTAANSAIKNALFLKQCTIKG